MNKINSQLIPLYKCHKVVRAFQIKKIVTSYKETGDGGRTRMNGKFLVPTIENIPGVRVTEEWYQRFNPEAGGYFIVYEDGYTSYSPREAFEKGYDWIG
jgi:hypothetical protein